MSSASNPTTRADRAQADVEAARTLHLGHEAGKRARRPAQLEQRSSP